MSDPPPPGGAALPQGEPHNPPVGHEETDADLRGVIGFGAALAASIVVVLALLVAMFVVLQGRQDREKQSRFPLSAPEHAPLPQTEFGAPVTGVLPPAQQLEGLNLQNPEHDVGRRHSQGTAALKTHQEEEELNSAGALKGRPGAVHIRIEDAMRLVAEEYKPRGREPAPVRYDQGVPGTGGGSNSGRSLPEARR
jgi:hypothetical protein